MGDLVNLRQARKNKQRAVKEQAADRNRIKFGRTKVERELSEKQATLDAQKLDGHKRQAKEDE